MAARSLTALRAARGGSDATSGSSGSDKAAAPAKQQQSQKQQAEAAAAAAAAKTTPTAAAAADADEDEVKSDAYTSEMQAKMGTSLTYRHELGINWNEVLPDLVVGSCLQGPEDVDRVAAAGVTTVLCLQEDSDLDYFGIDVAAIAARCKARGDIKHVRFPIRDFGARFFLRFCFSACLFCFARGMSICTPPILNIHHTPHTPTHLTQHHNKTTKKSTRPV
jgi:hypothetical protein